MLWRNCRDWDRSTTNLRSLSSCAHLHDFYGQEMFFKKRKEIPSNKSTCFWKNSSYNRGRWFMQVATHIEKKNPHFEKKKLIELDKFYVCLCKCKKWTLSQTQECKNVHYRLQFKSPSFCFVQTMWKETARLGLNVKHKICKYHVTWLKGISYSE